MTTVPSGAERAPVEPSQSERRKNPMEGVVETLATGLGNSISWLAESGVLFAVFAIIWAAFAIGLVWSQGSIDQAWQAVRALPLIVQVPIWILFLPVIVGLWIWETSWPLVVRLVLVIGVAGWNLIMFLPKAFQTAKP